jgi:predicted RNA-binding protein YlqC (UPF0109 family)
VSLEPGTEVGTDANTGANTGDADEVEDIDDDAGNRLEAPTPRAVLEYLARSIVDEPDAVEIDVDEGRRGLTLRLHVAPGDMGKVIGKRGRVAQAIRTIVRAAGARDDLAVDVDIVD